MHPLRRLKALLTFGWYVLAIVLVVGLTYGVWQWPLWDILARIGWWLSPNYALPFFWEVNSGDRFIHHALPPLAVIPGILLIYSALLLVVHAAIIFSVLLIHRLFGQPAYLKNMRPLFSTLLRQEARSIWWILLATLGLFLIFGPVTDMLNRSGVHWVVNLPFSWAVWLGFFLLAGMHASANLRRMILSQVSDDQLRCSYCGYLLYGLEKRRCPECGDESQLAGVPHYRLWRQRSRPLERVSVVKMLLRVLPLMVILALVMALWSTPPSSVRGWVQNSPLAALRSAGILPYFWWHPPYAGPVYSVLPGTVLVSETTDQTMVIDVEWSFDTNRAMTVAVWEPNAFKQSQPPREFHIIPLDNTRLITWRDSEIGFSYLAASILSRQKRIIQFLFDDPANVWGFREHDAPSDMQHVITAFDAIQQTQSAPHRSADE